MVAPTCNPSTQEAEVQDQDLEASWDFTVKAFQTNQQAKSLSKTK
jgi:hypothetical protein